MRRVRLAVRGEVQGVGFRYTMRRIAGEAGASGWVRNLRDGSVEAEVEGTPAQVGRVLAWAAEGPSGGRVDAVDIGERTPTGTLGFEVLPDA